MGCEVLTGHTIIGSTGRKRVSGLIVAPIDGQAKVGARRTLDCDCVGLSGGWTPAVHLFSQSRGALRFAPAMPTSRDAKRVKAFVDFQNDVTAKDVKLAVNEGFESIEHVKRYTTTGMATDQGKTSNMNALALAADALGKPIPQVGTTTFRPPYTPVSFAAIVGPS